MDSVNQALYAGGLLNRALDPSTQPPEIQTFLSAELDLFSNVVAGASRVIDIGCGTGRHLRLFRERLGLGIGIDYERTYIAEAQRQAASRLHFIVADAGHIPFAAVFDFAICLTNTWGTMSDKLRVLREMRRVAPNPHTRVLSVFSHASIAARCEWYQRIGETVVEETREYLLTEAGFKSEHFSESRLRTLVGDCVVYPIASIGYAVVF